MLQITHPITCPDCGKDMKNYEVKRALKEVIFRCKCGCMKKVSFDEYLQELRNKYQIK